MSAFKYVDCLECGEEFNISVTNTCPECKAVFSKPSEEGIKDLGKKKNSELRVTDNSKSISMEERMALIEDLLSKIHKNVAFFSWVITISIVTSFIWYLTNS